MTKEELLLLAGTCGGRLALTKKLKRQANKATLEEAAAYLKTLLTQHSITKTQLLAAFNPQKRAAQLQKKAEILAAKAANTPATTPAA